MKGCVFDCGNNTLFQFFIVFGFNFRIVGIIIAIYVCNDLHFVLFKMLNSYLPKDAFMDGY